MIPNYQGKSLLNTTVARYMRARKIWSSVEVVIAYIVLARNAASDINTHFLVADRAPQGPSRKHEGSSAAVSLQQKLQRRANDCLLQVSCSWLLGHNNIHYFAATAILPLWLLGHDDNSALTHYTLLPAGLHAQGSALR